MGRKLFSAEEDTYLEYLCSLGNGINNDTTEMFNKKFGSNRTKGSLASRVSRLGIAKKYPSKYSCYNKAIYQDYDWYYEMFVENGMNHQEMADAANCTKRVIEKWGQEKHHIDTYTRMNNKQLNLIQRNLVIGSLLGDGHIDKRDKYPLFIVSHAENQKEYLYYKYEIMKNLCEMTPTKYDGKNECIVVNSICNCQDFYRFNTRTYTALIPFRNMSKIDLLNQLNEFSFSIWMLDDGHCCNKGYWELCAPFNCDKEIQCFISVVTNKFDINPIQQKDNRYFRFHSEDSFKISQMILKNIPNDLDIVKYKILKEAKN